MDKIFQFGSKHVYVIIKMNILCKVASLNQVEIVEYRQYITNTANIRIVGLAFL